MTIQNILFFLTFVIDLLNYISIISKDPCTNDDFWCATDFGCVDMALVCDNHLDCVDGSDEYNCCELRTLKVLDQITLENKFCLNLKIRSVSI